MEKRFIVDPDRVRQIPPQFSWVDHRLVRDGHVQKCQAEALALYLFLVTVGDAKGLSYYSDRSLCAALSLTRKALQLARRQLMQADLVGWRRPFYQVLDLAPPCSRPAVGASVERPAVAAVRRSAPPADPAYIERVMGEVRRRFSS